MQRIDTISEQATAYELVYQHDRREFCKRDPETMAKNAGLKLRNGQITVPFYHTVLAVNAENGEVTYEADPTKPVPVYPRMMTLHHLNGVKDGAQNSGILIPFRKIPMAAVFDSAYRSMALEPFAQGFSGHLKDFVRAGELLHTTPVNMGDHAVTFQCFPKIALTFVFWDGDDELPANATVLFDQNIADFIHPEDTVGLAIEGANLLLQAGNRPIAPTMNMVGLSKI